jgi:hypothetical protein
VTLLRFILPVFVILNRHILTGLRASALPVLGLVVVWRIYLLVQQGNADDGVGMLFTFVLLEFAVSVCFAWFALKWHRFLILGERPHWLLGLPPEVIFRYGFRLFRRVFALVFGVTLANLIVFTVLNPSDGAEQGLFYLLWVLGTWVFLLTIPLLVDVSLGPVDAKNVKNGADRGYGTACMGLSIFLVTMATFFFATLNTEDQAPTILQTVFVWVALWAQMLFVATAFTVVHREVRGPMPDRMRQ